MKANTYEYPKSSLLGMPKDAALIMQRILSNQTVLKLLAYNVRDWNKQPTVTSGMIKEMFDSKQIASVPKVKADTPEKSYLRLTYGDIIPNATNPEYRNNVFNISILCHFDNWDLGNFELRPYRIAGEIDSMLDKIRLTGIGRLELLSCVPYIYDDDFAGVTLRYLAIRGNEDKEWPLNGE